MADTTGGVIERELLDEPHVVGRRVPVRSLYAAVEESGASPSAVAAQFDMEPATVHRALAYAHDHPEEMASVRAEREAAFEAFREERAAAANGAD
jgi:uncharacterized protein (DUF433 family)